jgi:hypothetical protein
MGPAMYRPEIDKTQRDRCYTCKGTGKAPCPNPERWKFHETRNTQGWVGIVDTHHEDAGHISGWVRPEDSELALAALNHFPQNAIGHGPRN